MTTVRTRFAPSPTGSLHIGNLRSALFSWLFARHHGGQFILRIEDTDQKRFDPNAFAILVEALRWTGLEWDEGPDIGGPYGPYVQSERLPLYQEWGNWLVEHDHAYRCYCTEERLEQVNQEKITRKEAPGYDRHCRNLSAEERAKNDAAGLPYVIRFKMPLDGQTVVPDAIRGDVVFENNLLQDAVLLKSDGFPTYHLAVIVDDHLMKISHVTRSNEWLSSAPLHVQLYEAFGWETPVFVHLPLLLNPDGKGKMSKRKPPRDKHGNLIPVMVHDYMRAGYLPEALTNFLANTGWNFGDEREVFSMAEAAERFDLSRLNPANSAFTSEKLDWLNGEHIRALPLDELARRLQQPLEDAGLTVDDAKLLQIAPVVQTRLKTLNDVVDFAGFFFHSEFLKPQPEDLIQKKMDATSTRAMLAASLPVLEGLDDFSAASQLAAMDALTGELGVSRSQLFGGLRVAVTGQRVSTPTFETMEILGKPESLRRIQIALDILDSGAA
ncbi:MAG: glutamate--tRNA ligase [Anaerolineaceae bacterium]|nr:glutamate--tRNA ligase [Anaerolineaceae bacterium]